MPACSPGRPRRAGSRTRTTRLRDLANFREGPEASLHHRPHRRRQRQRLCARRAAQCRPQAPAWRTGQAVVTGEGLAGRIAEVGDNSARVLFVTDVNSRLPVHGRAHARARHPGGRQLPAASPHPAAERGGRAARRPHHDLGPWRQLPGRHAGRRGRRRPAKAASASGRSPISRGSNSCASSITA